MRLLCILLVEYRAATGYQAELDQRTVEIIFQATRLNKTEDEIKQVLANMIECGGYYLNLEKHVGKGVCFVLGTALSETHWTKLITKSGPKFNTVLARFREIGLPTSAADYAALRQRLIDTQLNDFRKPFDTTSFNCQFPLQNMYDHFGYQAGYNVSWSQF